MTRYLLVLLTIAATLGASIGVAQEKMCVPRTIHWIAYSTAMVNAYYFYCLDEDFGPFFLKFGSLFPYPAKLCLNGHE